MESLILVAFKASLLVVDYDMMVKILLANINHIAKRGNASLTYPF